MDYNFEWDLSKAKFNIRKHKISFERAATVFIDPYALSIYDDEHSIDEQRWVTLGLDNTGILLVICHTFAEGGDDSFKIRIFSSRRATTKEIKQYKRGKYEKGI